MYSLQRESYPVNCTLYCVLLASDFVLYLYCCISVLFAELYFVNCVLCYGLLVLDFVICICFILVRLVSNAEACNGERFVYEQ